MNNIRIPESEQLEFQEQQSEIYQGIAQELIALIPEHWNSAVLELHSSEDGIAHSIWSDEEYKDIVTPSMELFGNTRLLELLFLRYDCMWEAAKFLIFLMPDGNWSFQVEYEYSSTA